MKNIKPYILIKIISNSKKVKSISSHKRGRINRFIKANNFENCVVKISVKYGPGLFNKGVYETKEDLISAMNAFLE